MTYLGPTSPLSDLVHAQKYRAPNESFRDAMTRIASALTKTDEHFSDLRDILLNMRFLPPGRVQTAIGSTKIVTPFNCFVSGTIEDSFVKGSGSIMGRATEAAETMRMGGGIGYDFSTLRPRGSPIKKLASSSSGPVSFMHIFDAVCLAVSSSGHRRGAQMGVLRVDHPDIEEFIRAKQNSRALTGFNISIAITDEFMEAILNDTQFPLRFEGQVYRTIWARPLWDNIMRSTYDWAEPGVLFIDQINRMNNLYYCETIAATNPCGEQPLPPYGACLLGSFNLVKYLNRAAVSSPWSFDYEQFFSDIPLVVRAMDRVTDIAAYPLQEQEREAHSKRRMGLGVTGVANAIEAMGHSYGSAQFISILSTILSGMRREIYRASSNLAKELGSFPLYNPNLYSNSSFIKTLDKETQDLISKNGIRNSHLLSIAPTGTISLCADNVSSGIEPVFSYHQKREIYTLEGLQSYTLEDYGARFLNTKGKTTENCSAKDHLNVLICASQFMDSAVSKTCNVPKDYPWEDFKNIYIAAWRNGCKGCTTYRTGGMREAMLTIAQPEIEDPIELSCQLDPATGKRDCE